MIKTVSLTIFTTFVVLTNADLGTQPKCLLMSNWGGNLVEVSLPSLVANHIGNVGANLNSFAPDRANNKLYALDWNGDLYYVDLCDNNNLVLVKSSVLSSVWGLAYDSTNNHLYAVKNWNKLYRIDLNDPTYPNVFVTSLSGPWESLVFSQVNPTQLWGYSNINPKGIHYIDIITLQETVVGSHKEQLLSMDWLNENSEDELLFPTRSSRSLYSYDVGTNIYTQYGPFTGWDGSMDVRGMTIFWDTCDSLCQRNPCDGRSNGEQFCDPNDNSKYVVCTNGAPDADGNYKLVDTHMDMVLGDTCCQQESDTTRIQSCGPTSGIGGIGGVYCNYDSDNLRCIGLGGESGSCPSTITEQCFQGYGDLFAVWHVLPTSGGCCQDGKQPVWTSGSECPGEFNCP